jgi:TRAP-type mannitol/chloroaromatic compound transport system permease small subunit
MKKFSEVFGHVEDWFMIISGVLVFVLMALTVVDVAGRYFFNQALQGSVEISEVLLLVITVLSVAGTQRVGGHVGMDVFIDRLKITDSPFSPVFQGLALLLTEAAFLIAVYYTFVAFLVSLDMSETTAGPLYIPNWPTRGILCLGVFLMSVRLAIQFIEVLRSVRVRGGRQ